MEHKQIDISGRMGVRAADRLREWVSASMQRVIDELEDLNEVARLLLGPDPSGESIKVSPPAMATTHVVNGTPIDYPRITAESVGEPDPLEELVGRFADALRIRLKAAREKYGYTGTPEPWQETGWEDQLREQLRERVIKGDPLDVAAYAVCAWHHGWSTARQPAAPTYDPDRTDADGDDVCDDAPPGQADPSPGLVGKATSNGTVSTSRKHRASKAVIDLDSGDQWASAPEAAAPTQPALPIEQPAPSQPRKRKTKAVIDRDTGERWASASEAADAIGVTRTMIDHVCQGRSKTAKGRRLAWAEAQPPVNGSAAKPPPDGPIDLPNGDLAEREQTDGAAADPPPPKRDFTARPIVDPNAPPAPINADTTYIPREVETQAEFDARRRREEQEARRKAETFPAEGGA